jgi:hypothetical protein
VKWQQFEKNFENAEQFLRKFLGMLIFWKKSLVPYLEFLSEYSEEIF